MIARGDAMLREDGCQAVGLSLQVPVGDQFAQMLNGDFVRMCSCMCFEGVVDAIIGWRYEQSLPKPLEKDLIGEG